MSITALEITKTFARLAKRTVADANGCHNWTGAKTNHGYGITSYGGKNWLTHRLVMTLIHGNITAGLEVHHKCFNTSCMNPNHLAIVSHAENSRQRNPLTVPKASTGQRGVYLVKSTGHFKVALRDNMTLRHAGTFKTMEQAVAARDELHAEIHGVAA